MPMHPKLTYHFHQYPLQPRSPLQTASSILRCNNEQQASPEGITLARTPVAVFMRN